MNRVYNYGIIMSAFSTGFHIGIMDGLCRNFFGFSPMWSMPAWSMPMWSGPCCCSNPFMNALGFNLGFEVGSGFGIFSRRNYGYTNFYNPPFLGMTSPYFTPLPPMPEVNWNSYQPYYSFQDMPMMDTFTPSIVKKESSVISESKNEKQTVEKKEQKKQAVVKQSANRTKIGGANTKYDNLIIKYAQQYDLDPNLVKAVIEQESGYNPDALGTSGEIGLMQLMQGTAKDLGVTDRSNPEQNIAGGAKYLRQLLDRYNNDLDKALAAYNAGMGNVDKGNYKLTYANSVKNRYNKLQNLA